MLKNVLKVLTGGLLAQILNFLTFPIITVWFGPAAFGDYAPFAFFVSFMPMIMSLRMEMAIMQDPKDSDKSAIIFLSLTSAFIVAGISGLMGTFLSTESRYELFLIIFCAFIASIQNMATSVANLKERYWAIAISRLLFSVSFFVIIFCYKDADLKYPLATSHVAATVITALFIVFASSYRVEFTSKAKLLSVLRVNFDYIKFDLPSNILNVSALLLPAYLIGMFFDDESAGLYFLAWKIIAAPLAAISGPGYVFAEKP